MVYTMARATGGDGIPGRFPLAGTATFADQMAMEDVLAVENRVSAAEPAVRIDRVRHLRGLIEAGRYVVSAADVAERLMASMFRDETLH